MRLQLAVVAMLLLAGCTSPEDAAPETNATESKEDSGDAARFGAPSPRAPALVAAHAARDAPDLTYDLRLAPRSLPLDLAQMTVRIAGDAEDADPTVLDAASVQVERPGEAADPALLGANETARITLALAARVFPCDVLDVTFAFAEGPERATRLQVPVPAEDTDPAAPLRLQRVDEACVPPAGLARPAEPVEDDETPAAPQQRVVGVYGVRNGTTRGLWDLKLMLESPTGANATDLSALVIEYEEGRHLRSYTHGTPRLVDGGPPQPWFQASWVRGEGDATVMQPGDLVELHFNLVDHELAERTDASITLLPEGGDPVTLRIRTPATYQADTIVTIL